MIYKKFFLLLFFLLILNSCGTIKEGFSNQKKNSSDEFLVEKKSPLSMPPDFEKLPIPKSEKVVENEIEENNLKKLIVSNQTESSETSSDTSESVGSFEKSLIEKIKNN